MTHAVAGKPLFRRFFLQRLDFRAAGPKLTPMVEKNLSGTSAVTQPPATLDWARHALFLDFDGTLAPLAETPDAVKMGPATTRLLHRALQETEGAVAVISGRRLDDLSGLMDGLRLPLSGSHGVEIRLPGAPDSTGGGADPAALDRAHERLAALAAKGGLLLERKPGAVALHYRNRPDMDETCRTAVAEAAAAEGLRVMHGNCVSEAAPEGIDKGTALRGFLTDPPFRGRRPVMIGDDTTDEDGFAAAQAEGGFGLRIGGTTTCARYRVETMEDALTWLAGTLTQTP